MLKGISIALAILLCSQAARAGFIDFVAVADPSHAATITYAGGASALVGTDIGIFAVNGEDTPLNAVLTDADASLSFTTGNFTGTGPSTWNFGAGGTFSVFGSISGVVNNQVLYSGTFAGTPAVVDLGAGLFKVFGGATTGVLNSTVASFYGLPTNQLNYPGGLSLIFTANALPGGAFNSTVNSGDFAVNVTQGAVVPEPASLALLTMGLGAVGLGASRRRKLPALAD